MKNEDKYTSVSVSKRKSGWQARLRYKENGKWKELSRMFPEVKGKKEAEKLGEDLRRELNAAAAKGIPTLGERTVDDVVLAYLDYQLSTGQIEESTYNRQTTNYKRDVSPYLGQYVFETLDRTAVIDWHTKLSNKGLAQSSIYNYSQIISKVYSYYNDNEEISRNPFKQVKGLHLGRRAVKVTHLTQAQMEKFISSLFSEFEPKDWMFAAMAIAFYTGLRRGELLALRWNDIDFEHHTLTVSSAIGKGRGGCYTKGPKNRSSMRTIPMLPQLEECLKLRYNAIGPKPNWFVCGNEDKFIAVSTFSTKARQFYLAYDLIDAYGQTLTTHNLRHNFATVGVRSNMDIAALSLIMGHASRAMTLDTYADANEESKKIGAKRLSETFKKDTEDEDYYEFYEEMNKSSSD